MKAKLAYPAIFIPHDDNEGYTVEVPDLKGCVTEGKNLADAIDMAIDAASGWILGELEDGNDFPKPSQDISDIELEENSFINYIVIDIVSYAEKYGEKAVRRNVSIPAFLNTFIEKNNISCSHVLRDALLEMSNK